MSQSSLVNVKVMTSHYGYPDGKAGRGGAKLDKIFVHHMAGVLTAEQCGAVFKKREASAHYGIDSKGRVGQYVLEENAAWHCANRYYNQRSIGIELSNDGGASTNWHVSDTAINKCIELIVDICKRNGIKKINYTGDLTGNLCMHKWLASTACPGGYLSTKFKYIADEANKKLTPYTPKSAYEGKLPRGTVRPDAEGADVKHVQTFLNWCINAGLEVDGDCGKLTVAAIRDFQATYGLAVDGWFGSDSKKKAKEIIEKYAINIQPAPAVETKQTAIQAWCKRIADSGEYKYKSWTSDVNTHRCPICYPKSGKGFNCICYGWASWRHGAGIGCKCNAGVVNNADAEKIRSLAYAEALEYAQKKIGIKSIKLIRGNQGINVKDLEIGDILLYYKGTTYMHTAVYVGKGKIADSASGQTPNIKYGCPYSIKGWLCKVAIRYTGK